MNRYLEPISSGPVTVCVTQRIKPTKELDFEQCLKSVSSVAEQFPGHQGINVIHKAGSSEYTYIFRFDSYEHLQTWENSVEKNHWAAELQALIDSKAKKQVLSGLEYWFTLPGNPANPSPPRYKMAMITIVAIYPLTTALSYLASPTLPTATHLLKGLLVSITAVTLMTYLIMPRLTRWLVKWLFGKATSM